MSKTEIDKSYFITFCIEQYKVHAGMDGAVVAEMFFQKGVVDYLHTTYGESIYLSLMNQYTPMNESVALNKAAKTCPELFRKVTKREYERLLDYVLSLNIKNAFFQEGDTASDSFIPDFDYSGV